MPLSERMVLSLPGYSSVEGGVLSPGELKSFDENGMNVVDVSSELDGTIDVIEIIPNVNSYAAIREDGSVISLGNQNYGGTLLDTEYNSIADKVDGTIDVVQIVGNTQSFAALREDGSVVTWGYGSDILSIMEVCFHMVWYYKCT